MNDTVTAQARADAAVERIINGAAQAGEIDLSIGEPDQRAPQAIVDAAIRSLTAGETGYTAKPGLTELRELLAEDLAASTGQKPEIADVTVTVGGTEAVAIAIMTACSPEAGILAPDPGWPNYGLLASQRGVPVHSYDQGESGDAFLDQGQIEAGLRAGARLIVVNSPSNPTSAIASDTALERLAKLAIKHDAWILSDEAYEAITFEGERAPSAYRHAPERTFVARTFSKTYSMTGFRVGAVISPKGFRSAIGALHGVVTGCASSTSQRAAIEALQTLTERGAELGRVYAARFELAARILGSWMPKKDTRTLGGFYLWLDGRRSGRTSAELCAELRARGIVVASGLVYTDTDGFIRIALTAEEPVLEDVLRQVREVLEDADTTE